MSDLYINSCRTCLTNVSELVCYYNNINFDGETFQLWEIFEKCTSLKINSDENFSQWICKECISKVSKAFTFRKQCWEADEFLRTSLAEDESYKIHECETTDSIEDNKMVVKIETQDSESCSDVINTGNYTVFEYENDLCIENDTEVNKSQINDNSTIVTENDFIFESEIIPEPSNEVSIDENYDDSEDDKMNLEDIDAYVEALINETNLSDYLDEDEFDLMEKIVASTSCDSPEDVDQMIIDFVNEFEGVNNVKMIESKKVTKKKNSTKKRNNSCEWVCQDCGKIFYKKSAYATHILGHKNPNYTRQWCEKNKGSFECTFCGKKYTNRIPFKTHLKIHDPNNPYKCDICGKICTAPSLLEYHKFSHNISNKKRFECNKCGKNLFNKADLRAHMRFHTGERPFKCTICNKAFYTKSHLVGHLEIHSSDKPYKCDICSKFFKTKRLLQHHVKLHDNNNRKELKCKYCSKIFTTKRQKIEHMLKHPQYKSFSCRFCFKAYMSQTNLDTHYRIHHTDLFTRNT